MQRVPDLTSSGSAVLPCTHVTFTKRKGTIYRDWDLKLVCDIGKKGDLPILPKLVRFARQPILQARAGGVALKGWKLETDWEGEWTITTKVDEEVVIVCEGTRGVLKAIVIDASENICKITYLLQVKASPDLASGFVEVDGHNASMTVVYDDARQPDLFTRPGDLPEPMDLPREPGEEDDDNVVDLPTPEPTQPRAKRKTKQPHAAEA